SWVYRKDYGGTFYTIASLHLNPNPSSHLRFFFFSETEKLPHHFVNSDQQTTHLTS
ncbi:unnamed protein product, partial [Prunus brigantina]